MTSAIYDALLLAGIWMGTAMVYVPLRDALGGDGARNSGLPALLFATGAAFFGWSWTHGGHTPGMLAWHLRVRRADAAAVRWPVALVRYTAMLLTWSLSLLPLLIFLPPRLSGRVPHVGGVALAATLLTLAALLSAARDGRLRAPCDRLSGTEVVLEPKRGD